MLSDITSLFTDMTSLLNQGEHVTASEVQAEVVNYLNSIMRHNELIWNDDEFISTVTDGAVTVASVRDETYAGLCFAGLLGNYSFTMVREMPTVVIEQQLSAMGLDTAYADTFRAVSINMLENRIIYNPTVITEAIVSNHLLSTTAIHAVVDFYVHHERRHAVQDQSMVDALIDAQSTTVDPNTAIEAYCAQPWEHDADMAGINYVRETYHI